jgi:hypothetical protein
MKRATLIVISVLAVVFFSWALFSHFQYRDIARRFTAYVADERDGHARSDNASHRTTKGHDARSKELQRRIASTERVKTHLESELDQCAADLAEMSNKWASATIDLIQARAKNRRALDWNTLQSWQKKTMVNKDCRTLRLVIEGISGRGDKILLTDNDIRTVAELRIRSLGITIADSVSADDGHLYLNVNISGSAFIVSVEYTCAAVIKRGDSYGKVLGTVVWRSAMIGTHGGKKQFILDCVSEKIDTFLNELKQNQKTNFERLLRE